MQSPNWLPWACLSGSLDRFRCHWDGNYLWRRRFALESCKHLEGLLRSNWQLTWVPSVLAVLLIRVAVFPAAPSAESDLTFNLVSFALASQATLSFTVTMQCIPSLKPVLDAFATGLLEVSLYGRAGEEARNMSSGNKYELGSIHRSFAHSAMVTSSAGVRESGPIARPQEKAERPPHRVLNRDRSRDSGRSDELGIVKTAAWEIRYEPMDGQEGEEYACSSSAG